MIMLNNDKYEILLMKMKILNILICKWNEIYNNNVIMACKLNNVYLIMCNINKPVHSGPHSGILEWVFRGVVYRWARSWILLCPQWFILEPVGVIHILLLIYQWKYIIKW